MKKLFNKLDKKLLLLMLIFTIFGLVMVFSASSISAVLYNKVEETYFFKRQAFIAIGMWFIGIFFILRIPTSKYKFLAKGYFFLILIILALIFPYGTITNSAKSWFRVGPIRVQPSEFFKSAMILYFSVYFEKLIQKKDFDNKKVMWPIILSVIGIGLVAIQPDLGTAIIIAGIFGLLILYMPIKTKAYNFLKTSGIIVVCFLVLFVALSGNLLTKEQADRLNFKSPCTRYTEKTGYQVCNGFIAISNGGLFGKGLGNSTQKYLYLPEAHTDFIFPIVVEEIGVIGASVVLLMYILLLFRLLKISKEASTIRGTIIAYGTFCYILLHLAVNFLGILALIPLTGVPVPFLSYGGSFLMNILFLMFVNERIAIETNINKENQAFRRI